MFKPKAEPSPRDRWFRSPDWDDRAQAEFETRLARARPDNRVQYRRIKALALLGSGSPESEAAGYQMLAGVVDDPHAYHFEKVGALSFLGAYDQEQGRLDSAERNLRLALAAMRTKPGGGGTGEEEIGLAEILLAHGGRTRLDEALELLATRAQDPPRLLKSRFRLCLAAARVSLALGHSRQAGEWASAALSLADATHSGLANHPDLGLVETDPQTREWLASVARQGSRSS
jgi:hypothetical protein